MHYLAINFNLLFSTSFPPQFIHMIEMEADDSQERFIKRKCLPGLTVCALVCCETQEQISIVYKKTEWAGGEGPVRGTRGDLS